jgi:hypothetical protein
VIDSKDGARADLGPARTRPEPLASQRALPFTSLHDDEFEILCYLLLKREHPGETILAYGGPSDGGRDILRPQSPRGCELIQCKRYEGNVGIDEIRKELAKLYTNVFQEAIPDRPERVTFYVSRDLTAPAKDLLRDQSRWIEAAEGALREHLRREPEPELLDFARTWWPELGWESEIELTERVNRQPELRDEFFAVKKVMDVEAFREILAEERRRPVVAHPKRNSSPSWPKMTATQRKWCTFFKGLGEADQAFFYLNDWPGLSPDQRFVAPKELPKIREALSREPLTFLIGPLAAGKTFTAVQLLWEEYRQGRRRVVWIAPPTFQHTEGPIPAEHGFPDMEGRIRLLIHHLGQPRDASDFISKFLEPDSLVYIEDPFGKRDDEFSSSLHTYKFFDLDRFVETLCDNAVRANCHILVTSRTGLFERWLEDRKAAGKSRPPSALIRIDSDSYGRKDRESFAHRLAANRGFRNSEDVAEEIAYRIKFPYEIERIIHKLPPEATAEDAEDAAKAWWGDLVASVRRQLHPETDGERLLLVATALEWPQAEYRDLYSHLGWPGDAEAALKEALSRLGFLIARKRIAYIGPGWSPFKKNYKGPSDELLVASHSSVDEGIKDVLQSDPQWLERLAVALPSRGKRDVDLAIFLLSLGIGKVAGPAQDGITTVLFENQGLSGRYTAAFMRLWSSCDAVFKERMFRYLKTDPTDIVRELAAWLQIVEVPAEDAWNLVRLLPQKRYLVQGGEPLMEVLHSHPWRHFVTHIGEVPDDLRDSLEELASLRPVLFTYALGEVLVERWDAVPASFKKIFLSEKATADPQVQEKVLRAIVSHWEKVPQELRDFFLKQSSQGNWRVREKAASAAWIYWERNPALFDPLFMKAVEDPDIRVPLAVLNESGEYERDQRFAQALLRRVAGAEAAEMLHKLLLESLGPDSGWKMEAARTCLERGGNLALAVLADAHFRYPTRSTPLWTPDGPLIQQPEVVRLGALHAYANYHRGDRDFLSPQEAITLAQGLSQPYRYWALCYFSIQAVRLPDEIRAFIDNLEGAEGEDGDAVRQGREHREPENGWSEWSFPVLDLGEELKKIEAAQAASGEAVR